MVPSIANTNLFIYESPNYHFAVMLGVLAVYTGLRSSDIANMEMSSVDWEDDLLRITQQKTGVPLELPLSAVVGNAIYDYLSLERSASESAYLFLSTKRPYGRLKNSSMKDIAERIMLAANIRQSKGDRRGFHIFRHYFATALLGNDVPQAVISRILGHDSPNSVETYLSADFKHLKECSLSIAQFPVYEEALDYE